MNNLKRRLMEKGAENAQLRKKVKLLEQQLADKEITITRLQEQENDAMLNSAYDASLNQIEDSITESETTERNEV
jgi:hypothetical protein